MKMFSCYAVNQALGETVVETSVLSVLCEYPIFYWLTTNGHAVGIRNSLQLVWGAFDKIHADVFLLCLLCEFVRWNRSSRPTLYFWIPGKHGHQSWYTSTPDLCCKWGEPDSFPQVVRS